MPQRKIIKGTHEVTKHVQGDDKSVTSSSSTTSSNTPSIPEYHQGKLVEYDDFKKQAEESEQENTEEQERAKRLEEENDAKIEEFKKKRNIKLQYNYTPYFHNKQDEKD
ncbi:hypothetical protein C9374_002312 [Naegleria lovaniensis]|uniref:Uncharacterized protein n=1 Tax=Naegleria lovaniensis TaxID=51637 RepID=A0AA88GUJ2_NAELO|nr:uncharacterized protein C9374_002312 [Naegleria lovaniensis]KAG2386568.1 hypothetical protein C9374_002312 [Naegleria lovaniensis]